jgi:DMSO/TMAO reductase YedYZ molybdopterin-dependent catalytic subunit
VYFVTTKRAGYVLFSTTPSGRIAVGLTEDQKRVHLLFKEGADWTIVREWPVDEYSHTDLMLALGKVAEPPSPAEVLHLLPTPRGLH